MEIQFLSVKSTPMSNEEVDIMEVASLRAIADELPILRSTEEREKLLGVVGALVLRRISLDKASEIMGMRREAFLGLLEALGIEYSYLEERDVEIERTW